MDRSRSQIVVWNKCRSFNQARRRPALVTGRVLSEIEPTAYIHTVYLVGPLVKHVKLCASLVAAIFCLIKK